MLKIFLTVGSLQLLAMLVMMLRTKILAVLLGPEQYGLMAALDRLVALFAQTASLSIPFAALRYLSPLWHSEPDEYDLLFRQMRNVLLTFLLAATTIALFTSGIAPDVFGGEIAGDRAILVAALCTIVVAGMAPFLQNVIASAFAPHRSMIFQVAHSVVLAISAVLGCIWAGLEGLYLLYAGLGTGFVVAILLGMRRKGAGSGVGSKSAFSLPRRVWRMGILLMLPAVLGPLAAYFSFYQLLAIHGEEMAGWMQGAVGISLAVRAMMGAAHQVFMTPQVNRDGTFEERLEWANNFQRTFLLVVGVLVPPVLLLSHVAVRVLYSAEFLPGAHFAVLFICAEILTLFVGTYQALVIAMDRIGWHVINNATGHLLFIAVAVLAIPTHGIAGPAFAALSAQAYLLCATAFVLRRYFAFRMPARVVVLGLYVAGLLLLAGWLGNTYTEFSGESLGLKFLVILPASAGLALFLDGGDWKNLRRLAGQTFGGDNRLG